MNGVVVAVVLPALLDDDVEPKPPKAGKNGVVVDEVKEGADDG